MDGYRKYKEKSIYSMSGAELLGQLFGEAVRRLKMSEKALDEKDYRVFDDCIVRTSRIVRYLSDILDRSQPISRNLRSIYGYLIFDLSRVRAGRERGREEIGRIRHILEELGGAFEEAGRKSGGGLHEARQLEIRS